jgi:hypothetical protein
MHGNYPPVYGYSPDSKEQMHYLAPSQYLKESTILERGIHDIKGHTLTRSTDVGSGTKGFTGVHSSLKEQAGVKRCFDLRFRACCSRLRA